MKVVVMRVKYVVGAFLVLLALVGILAVRAIGRSRAPDGDEPSGDSHSNMVSRAGGATAAKRPAARRSSGSRKRAERGSEIRRVSVDAPDSGDDPEDEEDDDMSPEDRRLMDAIEQGRDDDDLERLVKLIPDVSASTNAELRAELVDAIGWFDVQGMNHLLPFMADPDEDVRESAIDNWTSALSEVEDEKMRAHMVGAVMQVLTDEDALESMTAEFIDMDEKIALQTLIDVIEGGKSAPQGVAAAREQYEFITGDEYTTVEAANAWLAENYEPPEPEDGGGDERQNR